jgi:hypothetical protein
MIKTPGVSEQLSSLSYKTMDRDEDGTEARMGQRGRGGSWRELQFRVGGLHNNFQTRISAVDEQRGRRK